MILQCLSVCLKESLFPRPTQHHLHPSLLYFSFVSERDKSGPGYRYRCHMGRNEKALLSKQMGFLNIETAACLFNRTVLKPSLFHHFDQLPQPLRLSWRHSLHHSVLLNQESLEENLSRLRCGSTFASLYF